MISIKRARDPVLAAALKAAGMPESQSGSDEQIKVYAKPNNRFHFDGIGDVEADDIATIMDASSAVGRNLDASPKKE